MKTPLLRLVVFLGLLLGISKAMSAAAEPRLLNVQFAVDNSALKQGPAAFGLSPGDFWNRYSRDLPGGGYSSDGSLGGLKWADGSQSAVGLRIQNAPGAFGNGHPDPMFGTYLYPFNSEPITVTITNLPPGRYSVLAYGHGGPPNQQNTEFELRVGAASVGRGKTTVSADWLSGTWSEGAQYVRFARVDVAMGEPLILLSRGDGIATAFINGLQIIAEPEAFESLMNVTFGTTAAARKTGPAAVGQGVADVWNHYSRDAEGGGYKSFGALTNLTWADGSNSQVGLTIDNAPGAWGNGHLDPMFAVYLYPLGGGPNITVTITNLPLGRYSFYSYAHGGPPDNQNALVELSAGGVLYGERSTTPTAGWLSTNWSENIHYVRHANVVVYPGEPVVLVVKPGVANVSMINGLQIVRHDSPALVVLPAERFFTNSVSVRVFSGEAGAQVRFTVDGSEPLESSPVWGGTLRLTATTTLKVRQFRNSTPVGEVASATFSRVYALNDGITVEWRKRYFGEGYLTDPRVAVDADPDGDGADNLREFVAGTDPLDAFSGFAVSVRQVPVITWRSIAGKTYRIMRRESLSAGSWELFRQVTAEGDSTRLVDVDADRTWFYAIEPVR
jgi:hypothetical protein